MVRQTPRRATVRALGSSIAEPTGSDLLTTPEFIAELQTALMSATRSISLQLMTFDGDSAGLPVAGLLAEAVERGVQVRLLVDSFALRFVSDHPAGRAAVAEEFATTLQMYSDLENAGVELRFTHPNGPAHVLSLARNHKKIFVIDDVAYVGGINVSDHNYEWHDFMVRLTDPALVAAVANDFYTSFSGERQTAEAPIVTNSAVEATFDEMIANATERVVVASPYALDLKLTKILDRCEAKAKTVVLAPDNNFKFLQMISPYLQTRLVKSGVDIMAYGRFSHAKFLLADDAVLVGSSNYGRHSFWCNQEIGLVIRDPSFVASIEHYLTVDGLAPVETRSSAGRWAIGWLFSNAMIVYLWLYSRTIARRVPPLAKRPKLLSVAAGRWSKAAV